jgi:hypothetical protein
MIKETKNNRLGIVAGTNGGHNIINDLTTGKIDVKVPAAEKVEVPLGLAKASPVFKKVEPKAKADKLDEAKALEENEIKAEGNISISPQTEHTTPPTT